MSDGKPMRLGELEVARELITEEQLKTALERQRVEAKRLGEVVVELGFVEQEQLVAILSDQLHTPHAWLRKGLIDPKSVKSIPRKKAEQYGVLAMFKVEDTITLATSTPQAIFAFDDLEEVSGCKIQPVLCRAEDIKRYIDEYYEDEGDNVDSFLATLEDADLVVTEEGQFDSLEDIEERAEGSPIINLVNLLVRNAIKDGVSDIHIEQDLACLRVRYRVDGILHEVMTLRPDHHGAIVSRLKIMANLDIAERRHPQDGRIRVTIDDAGVDLRLSTMPTVLGEKVVLRILDKRSTVMDLDKLGFNKKTLESFKDALRKPSGLVLVTGPTGSGKTTTLYSAISMLNSMEKNVITIEDPVEYQFEIINQVQVVERHGLTFAQVLRAVLRQDPDIVMVGEIRDRETAEIAIQASLTGHLVLSTLHTNDAPGAVTRMIDMGIEPFLVASALSGVLAQRLVRTICPECRTMYYPGDEVLRILGVEGKKTFKIARGRGCEVCYDSGFKGRMGVHEYFAVGDKERKSILGGATLDVLRELRAEQGHFGLRDDALDKVKHGKTSMEEVTRVLYAEGDVDY